MLVRLYDRRTHRVLAVVRVFQDQIRHAERGLFDVSDLLDEHIVVHRFHWFLSHFFRMIILKTQDANGR